MAISSAVVAVGTTAVAVNATDTSNRAGLSGQKIVIQNTHASKATIYLGGANVSSANGLPLVADASITVQLGPTEVLYARSGSGTVSVYCLYQGV